MLFHPGLAIPFMIRASATTFFMASISNFFFSDFSSSRLRTLGGGENGSLSPSFAGEDASQTGKVGY